MMDHVPRILVADDDPPHRRLLQSVLAEWGYDVVVAKDGLEAWEALQTMDIGLVVTDWMMPGMDGLQLCRKIREASFPWYVYTILLTAKTDWEDLLKGLESGADDFVSKPFFMGELKARIANGHRIYSLEYRLKKKHEQLANFNQELARVNEHMTKDLQAAAWLQHRLLPEASENLKGYRFNHLYLPCHFVAGDIFNFFPVDEDRSLFYLVDVSGHGVASAMLSITITKILSSPPFMDTFHCQPQDTTCGGPSPVATMLELNKIFQANFEVMGRYFTMVLGFVDQNTGMCRFTLAGHPHPVYIPAGGKPRFVGESGSPIGLVQDVEFVESRLVLQPGDRLALYSDGVTECHSATGEPYGEQRLLERIEKCGKSPLEQTTQEIGKDLRLFHGSEKFDDDVSVLIFEQNPE